MPQWNSVAAFGAELAGLNREFTTAEIRQITRTMGAAGQTIAAKEAAADLGGDRAFSGWTRSNPIALDTRLNGTTDGTTILAPSRRSAGPWTVAEFGRNSAAGPRLIGPRLTKRGKISTARRKRYNGRTRGKGTASDATKEMDRKLPAIADRAVLKATRKHFDVT